MSESSLRARPFLILDCQTTGMRPSGAYLLEFAWAFANGESEAIEIHSSLIRLPTGESVPPRVKEITGIRNADMEFAREAESVRDEFKLSLANFTSSQGGDRPVALIHYAQFEEAWLRSLLGTSELPFDVLCTHRLSKKLFPNVPSRNVRGLTGFFGMRIGEIKRAAQHVRATQKIWSGIVDILTEKQITSVAEIRAFLIEKPTIESEKGSVSGAAKRPASYEYRVDRAKRLALPATPGIYKMLAKSGEILYVGKATSLKDRVNSYFRGKKGRDARKLELMAQVWDFETIECESAVEAALIESDEIKRLDPPYNVSLKERGRALIYYDRDLETQSLRQTTDHPLGPFRRFNAVEHLRTFANGLKENLIHNVFYQPIDSDVLETGYELFEQKYPQFRPESFTVREHLAFALVLLRRLSEVGDRTSADTELLSESGETEGDVAAEYTPEDILEKIERLYIASASTYLRTKRLTQLLWSDVSWIEKGQEKQLRVRGGQVQTRETAAAVPPREALWQNLAISDYDRMSILLTEISKVAHRIQSVQQGNPHSSN